MADERADGSRKFRLQGGPHDKMVVRLYPSNDGWGSLELAGHLYEAPDRQPDRGRHVLNWVNRPVSVRSEDAHA